MESSREPIRLALEIDRDAEPLAGRIAQAEGDQRPFIGWTGLAAVLSLILEEDAISNPGPPEGERS
jgi:hypothetical protein